ncbi:hypothetical protein SRHO_G00311510 [Serrasalmus rhombeus]
MKARGALVGRKKKNESKKKKKKRKKKKEKREKKRRSRRRGKERSEDAEPVLAVRNGDGAERRSSAGLAALAAPLPRRTLTQSRMQNRTVPGASGYSNSNVTCSCNCTASQPQGMDRCCGVFIQTSIKVTLFSNMRGLVFDLLPPLTSHAASS